MRDEIHLSIILKQRHIQFIFVGLRMRAYFLLLELWHENCYDIGNKQFDMVEKVRWM